MRSDSDHSTTLRVLRPAARPRTVAPRDELCSRQPHHCVYFCLVTAHEISKDPFVIVRKSHFMSSASHNGTGSGSALDPAILRVAVVATLVATLVSATSIFMHLKNYRKPKLQR
jgi:hypothetical protein